jgi:hypothetical protein
MTTAQTPDGRNPQDAAIDAVPERSLRALRNVVYVVAIFTAFAAAVELYAAVTCPLFDTVDFIFDDAYYYLGVAYNLAHGHGSTFRAPMETNGYLWRRDHSAGARRSAAALAFE